MKSILITSILLFSVNLFAQTKNNPEKTTYNGSKNTESYTLVNPTKQLFNTRRDEEAISLEFSPQTGYIFVSTTKGRVIVFNQNDSVIQILNTKRISTVELDQVGNIGAIITDNGTTYLFDQKKLEIFDSLKVHHNHKLNPKIYFTKSSILISTNNMIYEYTKNKKLIEVLKDYTILDYSPATDQLLIGYWDSKLKMNRKVQLVFICKATNINNDDHVFTVHGTFELHTYLMNNGLTIVSFDGKANYYTFNTISWEKKMIRQDTIADGTKRIYGLTRIDDKTVLNVRYDAFPITEENILKYNLKSTDHPVELLFKNVATGQVVKSFVVLKPINKNQLIYARNKYYYLTSEGTGNKLISITND